MSGGSGADSDDALRAAELARRFDATAIDSKQPVRQNVLKWSVNEVRTFIRSIRPDVFEAYAKAFETAGISGSALLHLTSASLSSLVSDNLHRDKIKRQIISLKTK